MNRDINGSFLGKPSHDFGETRGGIQLIFIS
jgi:hypothetical protein